MKLQYQHNMTTRIVPRYYYTPLEDVLLVQLGLLKYDVIGDAESRFELVLDLIEILSRILHGELHQ